MKLDRDQTLRAFPGFIERYVQQKKTPKELSELLATCKAKIGDVAVDDAFREPAARLVLRSAPADIVWWLTVRARLTLRCEHAVAGLCVV